MEFQKIRPADNKLWEQVWRLYTDSFPPHERRRISSHAMASEDQNFSTEIALENGNLLALMFTWRCQDTIYLEHLAVMQNLRGRSIGSALLDRIVGQAGRVVVEVEPPTDELSQRRIEFYKRRGFVENSFEYIHPSYQKNGLQHQLVIMSYPSALSDEQYAEFKDFVAAKVLKYID